MQQREFWLGTICVTFAKLQLEKYEDSVSERSLLIMLGGGGWGKVN
jgi:hypothetical protein